MLKIRRRQFFKLLKVYREQPDGFSLGYPRKAPGRKIDAKSEARIMRELKKEAEIIADKGNPVRFYNYSYLKDILEKKHNVHVSLPTIIRLAKKWVLPTNAFSKGPRSGSPDQLCGRTAPA